MNISSVAGYLIALATIWITVIAHSPNPAMLLDRNAFFLIIGGTLAATLVIYPISSIMELGRFIVYGVIFKKRHRKRKIVKDIVLAACLKPEEHHLLLSCPASHPFLAEGFKLLAENQLTESHLREVLSCRSQYFRQAYGNDAKMLSTIAKFPSSFGMLGSTVGLIDMMSELGKNGQNGIGQAMAMALVATFWGLVLTYMVFMPLGDYAQRLANEDGLLRQLMVEGLMMLKSGKDQQVVLEHLNGFLALNDRMRLRYAAQPQFQWEEIELEANKIRKSA